MTQKYDFLFQIKKKYRSCHHSILNLYFNFFILRILWSREKCYINIYIIYYYLQRFGVKLRAWIFAWLYFKWVAMVLLAIFDFNCYILSPLIDVFWTRHDSAFGVTTILWLGRILLGRNDLVKSWSMIFFVFNKMVAFRDNSFWGVEIVTVRNSTLADLLLHNRKSFAVFIRA